VQSKKNCNRLKVDKSFTGDLAELYNSNGFKYLSVICDLFSKKIWVKALKNKKPTDVIEAVKEVLDDGVDIQVFSSDRGSEYMGEDMQNFFKEKHIIFRPKVGPSKAYVAEHNIFLIKKYLFIYMRSKGLTDWENCVGIIVRNLNLRSNPAIGNLSPGKVTDGTEYLVRQATLAKFIDWHQAIENKREFFKDISHQKFVAGDYVYKHLNQKEALAKGHDTQIGRLYIITYVKTEMKPVMYKLEGLLGEDIPGLYYGIYGKP
jgi:hypothetical protein